MVGYLVMCEFNVRLRGLVRVVCVCVCVLLLQWQKQMVSNILNVF